MVSHSSTSYGFTWGPVTVNRLSTFPRKNGLCFVLEVETDTQTLNIYVSPTGKSVRVFRNGKELKG